MYPVPRFSSGGILTVTAEGSSVLLETIRMVTAALNNPTYGVNAQLPTLNLDSGDTTPADIPLITDETVNGEAARGRVPKETRPVIAVMLAEDVDVPPEEANTGIVDSEVKVDIRIATSDVETQRGATDQYYYMKAVERCMREFLNNTNAADRSRNGVLLESCTIMGSLRLHLPIDDEDIHGGIRVTLQVRDTQP